MAFFGFLGLLISGLRPKAWWRKLVFLTGMTSLTALYLIFLIMYTSARMSFLTVYDATIPYAGTSRLSANVLGLDFKYYLSPLVTATFFAPFYYGLLSIGLVLAHITTGHFRNRLVALASGMLGGIKHIQLSPPYHHVWISSGDTELNPLYEDPEHSTDDELMISFDKLYKTVDPGGSLSIILPAWATTIEDRFQKLLPYTGFNIEASSIVYRTPGVPETELRFRKPLDKNDDSERAEVESKQSQSRTTASLSVMEPEHPQDDQPPVDASSYGADIFSPKATPSQRAMIKAAVRLITERQNPVPYRELLNQVYMELVDKKIDFDSSRQIENTLLGHVGKELELVEETDATGTRWVRKWWLGEREVPTGDESPSWLTRMIKIVKENMPKSHPKKKRSRRRGKYRPRSVVEDE